jgi:hypothetical protein
VKLTVPDETLRSVAETTTESPAPTFTLVKLSLSVASVEEVQLPVTAMVPEPTPPMGTGQAGPSVTVTAPLQGKLVQACVTSAHGVETLVEEPEAMALMAIVDTRPREAADEMASSTGWRFTLEPELMQPAHAAARRTARAARFRAGVDRMKAPWDGSLPGLAVRDRRTDGKAAGIFTRCA